MRQIKDKLSNSLPQFSICENAKKIIVNRASIRHFNLASSPWCGNINESEFNEGKYFCSVYNMLGKIFLGQAIQKLDLEDEQFVKLHNNQMSSTDDESLISQLIVEEVLNRFITQVVLTASFLSTSSNDVIIVQIDHHFSCLSTFIEKELKQDKDLRFSILVVNS